MLSPRTVDEIKRLALTGMSQREIAKAIGSSRVTVAKVLYGEWKAHVRKPKTPCERVGPIKRCPTCGAKVEMPCLECQQRARKTLHGVQPRAIDPPVDLSPQLSDAEQARAAAIRAKKTRGRVDE